MLKTFGGAVVLLFPVFLLFALWLPDYVFWLKLAVTDVIIIGVIWLFDEDDDEVTAEEIKKVFKDRVKEKIDDEKDVR